MLILSDFSLLIKSDFYKQSTNEQIFAYTFFGEFLKNERKFHAYNDGKLLIESANKTMIASSPSFEIVHLKTSECHLSS